MDGRGRAAERSRDRDDLKGRAHDDRAVVFSHRLEPVALVQVPGRVVLRHAETDRFEAVRARAVQQPAEKLVSVAAAAAARNDGDRELRRLFVDEPEAGIRLAIQRKRVL